MPERTGGRESVFEDIDAERSGQDERFGRVTERVMSPEMWIAIIVTQLGLGMRHADKPETWRKQLVAVAASAVAAIEHHDHLYRVLSEE